MNMMVAMGLVKVLKGNADLYAKVEKVFASGEISEDVGRELVAAAADSGIQLDLETLLDELDDLLRNGLNGISVHDMGGLAGIMQMADNFM